MKEVMCSSCGRHFFQCICLLDVDWQLTLLGSNEELLKANKETSTAGSKFLKASLLAERGKIERTLMLKLMKVGRGERSVPYSCCQILKSSTQKICLRNYIFKLVVAYLNRCQRNGNSFIEILFSFLKGYCQNSQKKITLKFWVCDLKTS